MTSRKNCVVICATLVALFIIPGASLADTDQIVTKYHWCTARRVDGTAKLAWFSPVLARTGTFNAAINSYEAEKFLDQALTEDGVEGYRITCRGPFNSRNEAADERTTSIKQHRSDGWRLATY